MSRHIAIAHLKIYFPNSRRLCARHVFEFQQIIKLSLAFSETFLYSFAKFGCKFSSCPKLFIITAILNI